MESAISERTPNILRTAGPDDPTGIPELPPAQWGNKTSSKLLPLHEQDQAGCSHRPEYLVPNMSEGLITALSGQLAQQSAPSVQPCGDCRLQADWSLVRSQPRV
ncbi:unnamed protein product [Tetraodon nigroviridis]|uniref:(spotted green pufferfish) hypothetical protein n=1 Tax=Tetraodon nigroviridis TaxID=99883 RepID=Q4S0C4_TETNG|nr:unnamed protein product [Tetraodon nigroviridis]